jgi:hypothetical protein
MVGYTRQSAADIVPGEDILSGPLNDEFNQLEDSFNGSTGHSHDGTTGNGPKISLSTSVTGQLSTTNLADGSVTTAKIVDGSVTTAKIVDGSVTTAKIADSNVTTAKIADSNVTTAKIADGSITTAKILNNNITTAKISQLSSYTVLGNTTGGLANVSEVFVLNDGSFSANSSVALATQASIKTYVDNKAFNVSLPSQTGNSGKFVTTDGTNASWADVFPTLSGNAGKFLYTDGSTVSWNSVPNELPSQTGNANKFLKTDGTSPSWADPLPSQTSQNGKFLVTDGTNASWSLIDFSTIRVHEIKSGNFNATAFYRYRCETSSGSITATLPSSPIDGDLITIRRKGVNSVIVGRNGKTIAGSATDLTIDIDKREVDLKYNATTSDWEIEARAYL